MQKFRPNWLQKFRDFGLKSAIFESRNPTEPKKGLGMTKKFFWGLWDLFGAGRKNFGHPTPKKCVFGGAELSTKTTFSSFFRPNSTFWVSWYTYTMWRWENSISKCCLSFLDLRWCFPKIFWSSHPKKVVFIIFHLKNTLTKTFVDDSRTIVGAQRWPK